MFGGGGRLSVAVKVEVEQEPKFWVKASVTSFILPFTFPRSLICTAPQTHPHPLQGRREEAAVGGSPPALYQCSPGEPLCCSPTLVQNLGLNLMRLEGVLLCVHVKGGEKVEGQEEEQSAAKYEQPVRVKLTAQWN